MTDQSRIDYHLRELEIAENPNDCRHYLPPFLASDKLVLDIGCGLGQTFIASKLSNDMVLVGMDIDLSCLMSGSRLSKQITFVNGSANTLPFVSNNFDYIISRVSLPYTNIPMALKEIYRVLKPGGRIWVSLHPFYMVLCNLMQSLKSLQVGSVAFNLYAMANGLIFHFFRKVYPFAFGDKYESFQTKHGIEQVLADTGFKNISVIRSRFVVTAYK